MVEFIREIEADDEDEQEELSWRGVHIPSPWVTRSSQYPSVQTEPELDYSLTNEIRILRDLLTRFEARIPTDPEPEKLVLPLCRLVESIARTIRIHNGVSGGPVDRLDELVSLVLDNQYRRDSDPFVP